MFLLASTWLTTQAPSAAAGGSAHCAAFRGKRLLRSHSVTVIARNEGERREYAYICVPPRGRVHLAGWAFDETIGAHYSVKVAFTYGGQEFEEAAAEQPVLGTVAVNSFGEMLLAETLKGTTHVVGVRSGGFKTVLDSSPEASIPPSSLKLVGHEASWIDGGMVRRARI